MLKIFIGLCYSSKTEILPNPAWLWDILAADRYNNQHSNELGKANERYIFAAQRKIC
jgi:hypothetical protein